MRLNKIWWVMILVACVQWCAAQNPYYHQLSVSNGLPSNTVFDVMQDSRGYMWFAHNEGLSRYDGFEFITYNSAYQTSKAGGSLKEDQYGRVWYENFDGYLYYVENDTLRNLTCQKDPTGYINFSIYKDQLTITRYNNIDYYNLKLLNYRKSVALPDSYISSAWQNAENYYVSAGKIYAADYNSIKDSFKLLTFPNSLRQLGNICTSKNGILMYNQQNTAGAVYEYIGKNIKKKFDLPNVDFIRMIMLAGDYYWVCTPTGVFGFDENGKALNNGVAYFEGKNIMGTYNDREGNYWFLTGSEGVLMVPDINTKLWSFGKLIPKNISVQNNIAFVSTQSGDIIKAGLRDYTFTNIHNSNAGHDIINFTIDTARQTIFFSSNKFKQIDYNGTDKLEILQAVKDVTRVDDKYYAYAATGLFGLFTTAQSNMKAHSLWDSIHYAKKGNYIWKSASIVKYGLRAKATAFCTVTNTIYYATNLGLFALTPTGLRELNYQGKPLFLSQIKTYKNKVYGLGANGTLYLLANDIQPVDLQLNGAQLNIDKIKIANNYMFVFSGKELYYADPDIKNNGLKKIYSPVNTAYINDIDFWDKKLVFAIDKGLVMLDFPGANTENTSRFAINKFTINNIQYKADSGLRLSYRQNDIEINYSVLSFNPRYSSSLYYKINNDDWKSAPANTNTLKLASLSPGSYKIQFRIGNNPPVKTIQFVIKNPWWLEWWVWVLIFLLIAASGYLYYRWKLRAQRRENNLIIEKIELEKNLRHSMLTSIKSQMNPHFFYNALNTIQSYIFSDDKRNASGYLAKFSKLTRTILEMSEKDTVSLTEEVNALMLYLDLEKARFNDEDFMYSIVVDSSLDLDMITIPSMIVQPYVENAVKHGLLHKKGKKQLKVDFYLENNNLCILVVDNGIGRKKSAELNKIKTDKHNSFSSLANLKRIEILNKGNNKIGVEYTDKTDFSGNPLGTTVSITIPVKTTDPTDEPIYQSHNN